MKRFCVASVALSFLTVGLAQSQMARPALDSVAIVGAKVVVGNGSVVDHGTVLTRNGLIVAVGENVPVPPGTEIVDGTGLVVYPGFIDMGTTKGLAQPGERPKQVTEVDASTDVPTSFRSSWPSVRADLMAADLFKADDPAWQDFRSSGFTTALVYPALGVVKGTGALANLGVGGRQDAIVLERACLELRLDAPARDGYPDSTLGAFAVVRQLLSDADRSLRAQQLFAAGSAARGPNDANYEAVAPVLRGEVPAVFQADEESQIDRAISLAKDVGIRPIILGGARAYRLLSRGNRPTDVILSLAFPADPSPAMKDGKPDDGDPLMDEPEDRRNERKRQYDEVLANPGKLEASGVRVAFATMGAGPNELMENIRRAVKAGLSPAGALKGLTLDAATMLGLQRQLGTVEAGKIANLTILSGDFLDEKSKVKLVLVDGVKIDPSRTNRKPAFRRRGGDIE